MAMRKVNRRVKVGLTAMAFVLGGSFAVGNAAPGAYVTVRAEDEGTVSVRDRDGKGHDRHDDQYADPCVYRKCVYHAACISVLSGAGEPAVQLQLPYNRDRAGNLWNIRYRYHSAGGVCGHSGVSGKEKMTRI